jgi:hypothetical protein
VPGVSGEGGEFDRVETRGADEFDDLVRRGRENRERVHTLFLPRGLSSHRALCPLLLALEPLLSAFLLPSLFLGGALSGGGTGIASGTAGLEGLAGGRVDDLGPTSSELLTSEFDEFFLAGAGGGLGHDVLTLVFRVLVLSCLTFSVIPHRLVGCTLTL